MFALYFSIRKGTDGSRLLGHRVRTFVEDFAKMNVAFTQSFGNSVLTPGISSIKVRLQPFSGSLYTDEFLPISVPAGMFKDVYVLIKSSYTYLLFICLLRKIQTNCTHAVLSTISTHDQSVKGIPSSFTLQLFCKCKSCF